MPIGFRPPPERSLEPDVVLPLDLVADVVLVAGRSARVGGGVGVERLVRERRTGSRRAARGRRPPGGAPTQPERSEPRGSRPCSWPKLQSSPVARVRHASADARSGRACRRGRRPSSGRGALRAGVLRARLPVAERRCGPGGRCAPGGECRGRRTSAAASEASLILHASLSASVSSRLTSMPAPAPHSVPARDEQTRLRADRRRCGPDDHPARAPQRGRRRDREAAQTATTTSRPTTRRGSWSSPARGRRRSAPAPT